ncbi:MAG: Maf family protein [Candidatus Promineifilaceae bacterium]
MPHIILASQSPRRRQLLSLTGLPFSVEPAEVDESIVDLPDPAANSVQTARLKAQALRRHYAGQEMTGIIVLAADTNVALDNRILGKPLNASHAAEMLRSLCGREHQVYTGMTLIDLSSGQELCAVHEAKVTMRRYNDVEIDAYIAGGDPLDKAGAYGIQHPEFRPVEKLEGCFLGVMGMAVCQLQQMLPLLGLQPRTDFAALEAAHMGFYCPLFQQVSAAK